MPLPPISNKHRPSLFQFEVKEMKRRQEAAEAAERERREREAAEAAAAAHDAVDRADTPHDQPQPQGEHVLVEPLLHKTQQRVIETVR